MEKQLLLTSTLNTLLLADSSTTSITYKLVMLLIKRRKFLVKLSESILYETDVCFKRNKYRREIWVFWSEHSRKWEIYFVFCVTEHLRHMACSVIEINICSQDLQEMIIYKTIKKTLLQSTKDILSETIIIFHVFMRKPVLQICAEQFILGVEISDRSKKLIWNLPRYEFHIISEHVNTQINLTRRRYDFFQFHIGQFSYRASCKGRLTVSKQTLRLAGLKLSFSESFFHVETSQFL